METTMKKSRNLRLPTEVSMMLFLWTILAVVSILAVMTMGLAGCQADDVMADDAVSLYDTGATVYEPVDAGETTPPSVTLVKDETLCGTAADMAGYQREVSERLNAQNQPVYACGQCVYSTCASIPYEGATPIPSGGGFLWVACPIRAECLGY